MWRKLAAACTRQQAAKCGIRKMSHYIAPATLAAQGFFVFRDLQDRKNCRAVEVRKPTAVEVATVA
jgi:hypothetical protein